MGHDRYLTVSREQLPLLYEQLLKIARRAEPGQPAPEKFPSEISATDLVSRPSQFQLVIPQQDHQEKVYEDRWLKGIYAIARYWDRVSDGKIDGKFDPANMNPAVRLEPIEAVQTWLPVEELLFETASSFVGINFFDAAGEPQSCGSGIVWRVEPDPVRGGFTNYLVTNRHVIEALEEQKRTSPEGQPFAVQIRQGYAEVTTENSLGIQNTFSLDRVVYRSEEPDLAVFVVYTPEPVFRPVDPLLDLPARDLTGRRGLIVGYAVCERLFAAATFVKEDRGQPVIWIDGPMNPGHSGGGLFDLFTHRLAAFNFAKLNEADNIGLTIPVQTAAPVINDAIAEDIKKRDHLIGQSRSTDEYIEKLREEL